MQRLISIAPMMACTDRHYRMLMRIISRHTLLYTEMITTGAVIHGDRQKLLGYSSEEHPLALQLGGNNPKHLALASKIAEDFGYNEVNLNVGCPSDRVQAGRFGACLMQDPQLVADCVAAMQEAVSIPITVKTRIGVDLRDSYDYLVSFVETVASSGCEVFIIHARKAWLKGLNAKENREVPPLRYDVVYQLKRDFPELHISINGGVKTDADIRAHHEHVDGVMIGREAYSNPYWFADFDQRYFDETLPVLSRTRVVMSYLPYVARELARGVPLPRLTRHLIGLYQGEPGARSWRRHLSENARQNELSVIEAALEFVS